MPTCYRGYELVIARVCSSRPADQYASPLPRSHIAAPKGRELRRKETMLDNDSASMDARGIGQSQDRLGKDW